ncbi:aminotransferase class III-fold pyridoxal phosphate-dependent enzyme, partial [Pseudomonas syringae]|uniref:aminotransferase class III-fold pyridoxal phosphate-dependent enzyme n=2 Tax=Pseudomonas TaxID=286 RepID=UPI0034D5FA8F
SGGCVPVSAMVCTADLQAPLNRNPLMHTSTFGANPLAMAAVMATLQVMQREQLVTRAADLGQRLQLGLQSVLGQHPRGAEV